MRNNAVTALTALLSGEHQQRKPNTSLTSNPDKKTFDISLVITDGTTPIASTKYQENTLNKIKAFPFKRKIN
jgi:hypothetical protein